jgi:CheY-like chemotaxis protein
VARILVVDDEPDLRGMVRLILEMAGHQVVEAHHGEAALRRLHEEDVDLLITDVMMPVMSGSELIDRLRADPERANLPIIVLSASPHSVERADRVMRKPFAPADLRQITTQLLGADAHR